MRMVAPAWLKAGLTSAARSTIGSINKSEKRTAFRPRRLMMYTSADTSETPRQTGCMKNMENTSTSPKYRKLTRGW